jgi:hypothetical protein
MTLSITPPSEAARAAQVSDERPLEDLIERVPGELLMAEDSHIEVVDALEHDFWTDPCHFLRRACQAADYGVDERRA